MSKSQTPTAPRRKYDETFKAEAVRLVPTGNRSVPDVARSLGISENLPYNWKNKASSFIPRTTDSRHDGPISPNLLLGRDFPTAPGQVLVGDITTGGPDTCP